MNAITVIMVCFSMLGALDRVLGGKLGLAEEFERGFMLLGTMALSMIGMIVISPLIAQLLEPVFGFVSGTLGVEPSIIPASLFANDMGGAPLAREIAADERMGMFNGLVVASMMGCTISFTIPYALGAVEKRQHRPLVLGLLCGIVTIPPGCLAGGMMLRLPMGALVGNLLPLVLFAAVIAAGLLLCPERCVKIFGLLGTGIKILITVGLALAVFRYLTGIEVLGGLGTLEEGAAVCLNAAAVMTGAFPLMAIVSRALSKPLARLGRRMRLGETAVMGMLATLATNVPTFSMMKEMSDRDVLVNSAFMVSAAFVFTDHLAFTMAFDSGCISAMMVSKLLSGLLAVLAALALCGRMKIISGS